MTVGASLALVPFLSPWQRLVVVIVPLYAAIKTAVLATAPRPRGSSLVAAIAWPGLDPRPFRSRVTTDRPWPWVRQGLAVMALGLAGWAALAWFAPQLGGTATGWLGVAVLLTTVHLGFSDVLTGAFRQAGFGVRRLFRDPLLSRSLSDFWSRRWNLAYVELNVVWLLPMLRARLGRWATPAAFGFSGLFHELAISVPVGRGFGGPMAYFTLHAVLIRLEPRLAVARWPAALARLWTWTWLLLPLPLLFHSAFRDALVVPLFTWR